MDVKKLIKRALLAQKNPDLIKPLSAEETAILIAHLVGLMNTHSKTAEDVKTLLEEGKIKTERDLKKLLEETNTKFKDVDLGALERTRQTGEMNAAQVARAMTDLELAMSRIDAKISEVKDGQDGVVTEDEIKRSADMAMGMIKLPDVKKAVKKEIQKLTDAVEELTKQAKRIDGIDKKVKQIGAASTPSPLSWWRHEEFEMDGAATSVTLTDGSVGAGGNAVIVRYQGQTLDMTSQYTVNGSKITLVGITPAVGEYISVTYQPM